MARFCGKCGSPLKEGQRFCGQCGAPTGASAGAPLPRSPRPRSTKRRLGWQPVVGVAAVLILGAVGVFAFRSAFKGSPQRPVGTSEPSIAEPTVGPIEESPTTLSTEAPVQAPVDDDFPDDNEGLYEVNPFGGMKLEYEGYAGTGRIVGFNTDDCPALVRDNVSYSLEQDYSGLKNGDKVVVKAACNAAAFRSEGYYPGEPVTEYTVSDLPEIRAAGSYHEGVTWARIDFGLREQWAAVDLNGTILFTLDEASGPVTHFCNGVSIVDFNRIVNTRGETVWSIEADGKAYAEAHWGMGNVENILIYSNWHNRTDGPSISESKECIEEDYFGYTQVQFELNTFDYTGCYTGFLNADGSWYLEPTELKGKALEMEYGVYRLIDTDGDTGFYNVLTNEMIWEGAMDRDEFHRRAAKWRCKYYEEAHNGMIYVSAGALGDYLYSGIDNLTYDGNMYNSSGEMVLDLSRYELDAWPYPTFTDGYMLLRILNGQRANFYTVLDTSGRELFEPRKRITYNEQSERCSEGRFWFYEEDVGIVYYNADGTRAFETPRQLKHGGDFHEGRALVCDADDVWYFIDSDGQFVY